MRLSLLEPVIDRPGPWASLYTEAVPSASVDAAKQRELSARAGRDRLGRIGVDPSTCDAVYEALLAPPEPAGEDGHGGRAVLAARGEVVLDRPLPAPPPGPRASWSRLPRIAPLLDLLGEDPACLVVELDGAGARFRISTGLGRVRAGEFRSPDWPVHREPAESERHHLAEVESNRQRTAEGVADAVRACWERTGPDVLLLVGDARDCRAVRDRLPEPLRASAAETWHGANGSGGPRLERDIAQVRAVHEVEHVADAAERYRSRAGRSGHGGTTDTATGVPALVEAAREHRIETLLLAPTGQDLAREVWVGTDPDQLGVRSSDLHYLGELHPSPARADDALLRAAAASGADAVVVHDPEAAPLGGIGAVLRWPAPDPH